MIQSSKDAKFWKAEIQKSVEKRQRHEKWWDANMRAYAPSVEQDPDTYGNEVNTNRTFTLTERKKSDAFYQGPEVTLSPTPLMDQPIMAGPPGPDGRPTPLMTPPDAQGQSQPVKQTIPLQAHQEIINEKLGPDGIDATEMMDEVTFDVFATQGAAFTKMGYELYSMPTPDPNDPTGEALMDVPVKEQCFWEHFSGKQAVIPHGFRSTRWERAPYLGIQFELPLNAGNRQRYNLPPDFEGSKGSAEIYYDHGHGADAATDVFRGTEIWYRSVLYREDIFHPDHVTQLVLVEGVDEPVIHRDSPYQTLDDKGGLTPDSLIGFPIHPFSVRKMTDSAYVPSDGTMIRPLEHELNRYREQMVEYRDANILRWQYNTDTLPPDALTKIVRSPIGGMIGVPGEAFAGEGAIKELPQGSLPRDNMDGANTLDGDMARITAVDASGSGVQAGKTQTATAEQLQQSNASARMDKERSILLKRYCKGVTKFSTLQQRFLSVQDAAAIVGESRAQLWDVWRKQVPSALAFTAMPDSALRVDQAVDRKQAQELYSFLANDPFIAKGRVKLLEKLLRKFHIDPEGIVATPDPPKPEPPKLALSFKGEDLVGPQAPIVIEILAAQGIKVSPEAISQSQGMLLQAQQLAAAEAAEAEAQKGATKHGGKLAPQESLSKHAADQTGAMQGLGGAPSPMGAGGIQ